MKRKIVFALLASFLAFGMLTGCGQNIDKGDDGGDDDGGGGGDNPTPTEIISGLDIKVDEAQNKLKQLGSTQGFEITLEAISQEDDGTTSKESATIGFKVETAWLAGEGAYVMTRDGTETYAYTATSGQYDYVATIDGKYFDNYITTITSMFYIAYSYNSYLDKVGPTTFLGRPATEYKFAGQYATAFADLQIIIDDATGITLKYAGKAQDLDGNAAAGCLVVTAFKTGDAVTRPVLNKNSGGQQQDDKPFDNKELVVTDVSAANDNLKAKVLSKYNKAYISLFADNTFELVNPVFETYDVAMGTFTVDSNTNSAALTVNKLFDGEHQAYTTNVVDELKGLVLKYDPTSTDYSLKMSGMDSDGSSIEFTLILGATKNRPTHVQLPEEQGQGGEGGEGGQGTDTVAVTSVSVSPETLSLKVGEQGTLTARVLPENATDKTVSWRSDDQSIATVNNGVVTAVAEGRTKIIASAGEKFGVCELVVTAKGQGGEGGQGQGEDPQVQYPTAGKYSYNATLSTNPGIYENGYFQIDEDGNGVYCIVGDYLGERVWYTASFELDGLDILAHTVFKYTEVIETGRKKETVEQVTYSFKFEGDANWSIEMNDSKIYYQYDQGQGGETPVENLDDALVSAQEFTSLVNEMAYIGAKGNAKFNKQVKNDNAVFYNEDLENDNGNYLDGVAYAESSSVTVRMYGQSAEVQGYYDVYERNKDYSWSKYGPFDYGDEIFGEMAGLYLLSQVPFAQFSAPISEKAPYYSCASYQDEEHGVDLTNIKVYFNKGQLVHFSYASGGFTNVDVEVTDIGSVKLELPEVKPEEKPEQHNELLYDTNGGKFVYDSVDTTGYEGHDLDATIAAMPNCYFNFFKDGSGELINTNNGINCVYLGSYTLMKESSSNIGTVSLTLSEQYVNGVKTENYTPDTQSFTYKAQEDELHLIFSKDGHNVDFTFMRSVEVPTPYVPEGGQGGGDQPQDSNWPAQEIAVALKSVGFGSEVIPAIVDPTKLTEKGLVEVVGKEVVISLSLVEEGNEDLIAYYTYVSALSAEDSGYTMDYNLSDGENDVFVFNSASGKMSLYLSFDADNSSFTIVAKEKMKAAYPTEAISGWLLKHGVTDEIIEFTCEGATNYNFSEEGSALSISIPADASASDIINGFKTDLMKNHGYAPMTITGYEVLVAPNKTIGFLFMASESGTSIGVGFIDGSYLQQSSDYPSDDIDEFLTQFEITDEVPDLLYEGATYTLHCEKDEEGFWPEEFLVAINLPDGTTSESAIGDLEDLLTDFTWDDDREIFVSKNKQVGINLYSGGSYIGVTIIPLESEEDQTIYPSDFINEYLKDNGVTDLYPDLSVEGATYVTNGEKDEEGFWPESIDFTINLPDGVDSEAVLAKLISSLEGYELDEGEGYYVSENGQIATYLYAGEGYIQVDISALHEEEPSEPEYVDLTFTANRTDTVEGQRIYLVGDFCNWDPTDENAIAFDWDGDLQAWVAVVENVGVGTEIHCKLVKTSWDDPSNIISWEKEGEGNERVWVVSGEETSIILIWGNYR